MGSRPSLFSRPSVSFQLCDRSKPPKATLLGTPTSPKVLPQNGFWAVVPGADESKRAGCPSTPVEDLGLSRTILVVTSLQQAQTLWPELDLHDREGFQAEADCVTKPSFHQPQVTFARDDFGRKVATSFSGCLLSSSGCLAA